ncbi:unnamed protein product, partial [Linum tenue]
ILILSQTWLFSQVKSFSLSASFFLESTTGKPNCRFPEKAIHLRSHRSSGGKSTAFRVLVVGLVGSEMEKTEEVARKSNKGGSSCCLINDVVPEELLTKILIRLPLDQIFRCKSVCKNWLSLIQNPLFSTYYTKKKKKKQSKKRKKQKKKKKSTTFSCNLNSHPQQRSAVLIPNNKGRRKDERKRLKFSLDFVPDISQLHGVDTYNDLLQRVPQNLKENQKRVILGSNGLCKWHPPNYYTTRDLILGSSNGLLLCAPLLFTQTPGKGPVFDDFAPIYVVCNPHTKQWLQVKPPPPFCSSIFPHATHVSFVSDFDSDGGCWFKIIRLPLEFKTRHRRSLELQVFSSKSWEWTATTVPSLPRSIGPDYPTEMVVAVELKKKNGSPRLCWLFKDTQAVVYDPINNVVDAVIGAIRPPNPRIVPEVFLDEMCVSKGCLWAGSLYSRKKLKIYKVSGKKWKMVEDFDMMHVYNPSGDRIVMLVFRWIAFVTMNPDDPQEVYLRSHNSIALLNLRSRTLKVLGALGDPNRNCILMPQAIRVKPSTIICDNPLWPTPLPSFSSSS